MAQQGQGQDPSDRLFIDLRSKNEEVKNKAAADLRDLITVCARGLYTAIPSRKTCTDLYGQSGHLRDSALSMTELRCASVTLYKERSRMRNLEES